MRAIFKKEINQYFHSIVGYVFLAMFALISGLFFTMQNLLSQNGDIRYFFSGMVSVLMFLTPILTMRLFAEEKKIKTDQLLLTAPVSLTGIVMGKFLAAMAIFGIGMAMTLIYPITLSFFGKVDIWVTVGNYFALAIVIGTFIAIGIFISALTESQVVAAVVTYCVLFGLLLIGNMGSFFNNEIIIKALDYLSIFNRYGEFTIGIFNPASALYYASIIFLFLFLTVQVLERRRWN